MRTLRTHAGILMVFLAMAAGAEEPFDTLPPIGIVDFYGLRKVSEADVRAQLPFKEGDELTEGRIVRDGSAIARALDVADVKLAYICCTPDQKMMVFVGVAESPPQREPTLREFTGTARLPADMLETYAEFELRLMDTVTSQLPEDRAEGHSLSEFPPMRAIQQRFLSHARDHTALLQSVLTTSSDVRHRNVAAMILGYAPDKQAAARGLALAVADPDDGVRNNATRGLAIIAGYAAEHPELGIHIDAAPFVAMLNSLVWSDRNKGIFVLIELTASRDDALLALLRRDARPALIDMCRWKNPAHAISACMVLRRVEGLPDESGGDARAEILNKVDAGANAAGQ